MLFVPKSNGLLIFYKQNIDNKLFFGLEMLHSDNIVVYAYRKHAFCAQPIRRRTNRPEAAALKGLKRKKPRRICIPHVNVVKCICYAN